jgi:phospholipid transport system transporter-binding protein
VIRREGRRMMLSGPVTLDNVAAMLEEGRHALEEGACIVDLGEVGKLDSSLLALMLAWMRDARAHGRELQFANLPQPLQTIARLYGVEGMLPVTAAA